MGTQSKQVFYLRWAKILAKIRLDLVYIEKWSEINMQKHNYYLHSFIYFYIYTFLGTFPLYRKPLFFWSFLGGPKMLVKSELVSKLQLFEVLKYDKQSLPCLPSIFVKPQVLQTYIYTLIILLVYQQFQIKTKLQFYFYTYNLIICRQSQMLLYVT